MYTAEAKESSPDEDPFSKYRFVPDFGESYSGKKHPAIYLFDWKGGVEPNIAQVAFTESQNLSLDLLLGHAVFAAENRIFAIGYEYSKDGRLLGVIYCPNRAAALWDIALPNADIARSEESDLRCASSKLTSVDVSCRSPRVLPAHGNTPPLLVWVSNPAGGPHATCSSLHAKNLLSGEIRTLVGAVWDPKPAEFPGLYMNTLPAAPFISVASKPFIAFSSSWRSRSTVLLVSLEDGEVTDLTPDEDDIHYSWTMLCTNGSEQIICTRSALTRPPELLLGRIDEHAHVYWRVLALPHISDDCEYLDK